MSDHVRSTVQQRTGMPSAASVSGLCKAWLRSASVGTSARLLGAERRAEAERRPDPDRGEAAGESSTAPERDPPPPGGGDAQSAIATGRQPDPAVGRLAREQQEASVGEQLYRMGTPPVHDHRDPLRQRSDAGVSPAPERSEDLPGGNLGDLTRGRVGRGGCFAPRCDHVVGPRAGGGRRRHGVPLSGRGLRTVITGAAGTDDDGQREDGGACGPPVWAEERGHGDRQCPARLRRCQWPIPRSRVQLA